MSVLKRSSKELTSSNSAEDAIKAKKPRKETNERHVTPSRPEVLLRTLMYARIECQHRYVKKRFSKQPDSETSTRRGEVFSIVDSESPSVEDFFPYYGLTLGELATHQTLSITGSSRKIFETQIESKPTWILKEDERGIVSFTIAKNSDKDEKYKGQTDVEDDS